jgi:hypothetical protein
MTLNDYLRKIKENDPSLTEIVLSKAGLNDVARLMSALKENPNVASLITKLCLVSSQLTSIDLSALTALTSLHLNHNRLTSIDVSELTALKYLYLNNNQLTGINMAGLTELTVLDLSHNRLTSIDLSGLISLTNLHLNHNLRLTSIDLSKLTELTTYLDLSSYQLTMATKLAIRAVRPNLVVEGINNIAEELTTKILQEHFETIKPVFLASMEASEFKNAVMHSSWHRSNSGSMLPLELIMMVLSTKGVGPEVELNKNITVLRNAFANDKQKSNILKEWLATHDMKSYMKDILVAQYASVESLLREFRQNIRKAVPGANKLITTLRDKRQLLLSTQRLDNNTALTNYCGFERGFLLNRKNGLFN